MGIMNYISRVKGYSWCYNCGQTWEFVEGACIPYRTKLPSFPGSVMFPVCKGCFDSLSEEEILKYAKKLLDSWIEQSKEMSDESRNYKEKLRNNYVEYLNIISYNIQCMKKKKVNTYERLYTRSQ